jgi:dolichol kinase
MLTLAFADAAAGYIGYTYGKRKIIFFNEEKSWAGFWTFYIVTLFLYLKYFGFTFPYLGFLVALVPALVELF